MWITVKKERAVEIDDQTIDRILGMYPEEELSRRTAFHAAKTSGEIELDDLRTESDKILIPWQLFLLDEPGLSRELQHIEKQRIDKISAKLVAKRRGQGHVTSKRIIDRQIRLQNFVTTYVPLPRNPFCGSLKKLSVRAAVQHILDYFEIDVTKFRAARTKADALNYLIQRVENRNINVSQGVLSNKMLPNWRVVSNSVYRNTSGFVVKDEKMPFVFLPSEINPEETDGRQIYTLVYLLVVIGMDEYGYFLERDFKAKALSAGGTLGRIYNITSELLLPSDVTEELRDAKVTAEKRDELATRFKITPTAVIVSLRRRKIISKITYEGLLPPPYVGKKRDATHFGNPRLEKSVRKFCGRHSFEEINRAIRASVLTNVQAQYLLFGMVNKKNYKIYRDRLKI